MKIRIIILILVALVGVELSPTAYAKSTRKERRLIMKGNDLYRERKFVESQSVFEEALRENSSSAEARYNLGLSQIRQVANLADTTAKNRAKIDQARKNFQDVASLAKTKPGLAAKANLNLGNIEFKAQDFQKAVDYYKQALRIDPNDEKARKNLRIAQLNLKKQNQDKNKDKNQDKKEQDKKDQNKDRNKDQDKDKDRNKDQNKDKNKEQKQNNLSQQTASQILQAVDNKESATRARVTKGNGKNTESSGRNNRRW